MDDTYPNLDDETGLDINEELWNDYLETLEEEEYDLFEVEGPESTAEVEGY